MDFNSFFKKFFNDNDNFDSQSYHHNENSENSNRDDAFFDDHFERFYHPDHFERFNQPDHIFQQMEDMFNKTFSVVMGFPRVEDMLSGFEEHTQMPSEQNPRSFMLKDPEKDKSSPIKHEESSLEPYFDFRKEVNKSPSFSSKFSSVKTVWRSDGTVEEHRTVIDGDGTKTTKIRRSIDDTTHEVITKSDKEGVKEKEENFLNMDENEITDFEKRWSKFENKADSYPDGPSVSLPKSTPMYSYILQKFFGPSQKEDLKWC